MAEEERATGRCNLPGTIVRLIRPKYADRSFDREFWQSRWTRERFAAPWQFVVDMRIFRGEDEVEPRLLRHVQGSEYRQRWIFDPK
ncbi:MAG TPA: hypothetical protein VGA99_08480 [bacterium]